MVPKQLFGSFQRKNICLAALSRLGGKKGKTDIFTIMHNFIWKALVSIYKTLFTNVGI